MVRTPSVRSHSMVTMPDAISSLNAIVTGTITFTFQSKGLKKIGMCGFACFSGECLLECGSCFHSPKHTPAAFQDFGSIQMENLKSKLLNHCMLRYCIVEFSPAIYVRPTIHISTQKKTSGALEMMRVIKPKDLSNIKT